MKRIILIVLVTCMGGLLSAQPAGWEVDESDFEYSMTLTAIATLDGTEYTEAGNFLAVFAGDACRGVAEASYVESYDKYLYFLTVFSNEYSGEELVFKCYNSAGDEIVEGFTPATFSEGLNLGTANVPAKVSEGVSVGINSLSSTGTTSIQVYPNPAVDVVTIEARNMEEVLLMDMTGRLIQSRESDNSKAEFSVSSLPKGLYFLSIKTVGGEEIYRKLMVK